MTSRYQNISAISDLGLADGTVAAVKAVATENPEANWVDITHEVKPFDISQAGLLLTNAPPHLNPGIVLALVDPAASRPVAIVVGDGESVLVGPDNGVLAPAVALVGGATSAFELSQKVETGQSRSVELYARVAAQLVCGAELSSLGTEIDPVTLVPGILPVSESDADGSFAAQILMVDRFGNCHLNVDSEAIANLGNVQVKVGGQSHQAQACNSVVDVERKKLCVTAGSNGLAIIAVRQGSAADLLGLIGVDHSQVGVTISAGESASEAATSAVPVELKL